MNIQTRASEFQIGVERIDNLLKNGFSKQEIFQIVAPQRTLSRRKDKLNLEESDKVQRLERIIKLAEKVFGTLEKANLWLRKPNRAMAKAVPLELLISETGAREVEMQLHAIDHGMYA